MVERILIDTDILIDYVKGRINLSDVHPHICEITVYEFIRGTDNPERAKELLETSFDILWIDNKVLLLASIIWRELKKKGKLIDDRDLIVGATAITNNIRLFTRNKKHYSRLKKYGLKFYMI